MIVTDEKMEHELCKALDLMNQWAREAGVPEANSYWGLSAVIDRVWERVALNTILLQRQIPNAKPSPIDNYGVTETRAGLPGSSGSSKADERTNKEHGGAQEHNVAISGERQQNRASNPDL